MNVLRRVWLAGLALWLAGCGYVTPESPDPGQVVVSTATDVPKQQNGTATKSDYEGIKIAPGSRVEEIQWGGVRVDGIPGQSPDG